MTTNDKPSELTATQTEIEGKVYDFQLLKLRQAMAVQSKVARLIAQTMGKGDADDDLFYTIGERLCVGVVVDGFEITDLDAYFARSPMLFNQVVLKAAEANFPDLFKRLKKSVSVDTLENLVSKVGST